MPAPAMGCGGLHCAASRVRRDAPRPPRLRRRRRRRRSPHGHGCSSSPSRAWSRLTHRAVFGDARAARGRRRRLRPAPRACERCLARARRPGDRGVARGRRCAVGGVRGDDWTGFALGLRQAGAVARRCAAVALAEAIRGGSCKGRCSALPRVGSYRVLFRQDEFKGAHQPARDGRCRRPRRAAHLSHLRTADGLTCVACASRNGAAVVVFPGNQPRRTSSCARPPRLRRADARPARLRRRARATRTCGWSGARDVDAGVGGLASRADVPDGRIGGPASSAAK